MLYLSLGLGQVSMMGRDLNDMSAVIAVMLLIIALGYIVDGVVFKGMERHLQNKWGLTPAIIEAPRVVPQIIKIIFL